MKKTKKKKVGHFKQINKKKENSAGEIIYKRRFDDTITYYTLGLKPEANSFFITAIMFISSSRQPFQK